VHLTDLYIIFFFFIGAGLETYSYDVNIVIPHLTPSPISLKIISNLFYPHPIVLQDDTPLLSPGIWTKYFEDVISPWGVGFKTCNEL
jgi:hypothetical protein